MKKLFLFFFVASLALNAALAFFFARGSGAAPLPPAEKSAGGADVTLDAPVPTIDSQVWPSLRADDLPTLVEQLRAAGFPSGIIRAIVRAQLGEVFSVRRKELDPEADTRPFWKTPPRERTAAIQKLAREREKTVSDLLGEDDSDFGLMYRDRGLDCLPSDKAENVRRVVRSFNEKRSSLLTDGPLPANDREKMAALDREQHEAIARLLSPAELEEYDLRASNTASLLRNQLVAFNPTEEEFRALFRLRQPFENQSASSSGTAPLAPEQRRQRDEAQKQLNEQIKAVLGPQRAAEYERATDYDYRQASQLVARLKLPPETTNQLWTVQKDIEQRTQALKVDRGLTPEQRTQQLEALGEEAEVKVTATLGDRGFEAYKQYGGRWMQQLQPPPAPPAPTPAR